MHSFTYLLVLTLPFSYSGVPHHALKESEAEGDLSSRSLFLKRKISDSNSHPKVLDDLHNLEGCGGEICGTLSGDAIGPLLAGAGECAQQDMADRKCLVPKVKKSQEGARPMLMMYLLLDVIFPWICFSQVSLKLPRIRSKILKSGLRWSSWRSSIVEPNETRFLILVINLKSIVTVSIVKNHLNMMNWKASFKLKVLQLILICSLILRKQPKGVLSRKDLIVRLVSFSSYQSFSLPFSFLFSLQANNLLTFFFLSPFWPFSKTK